jgi:hypothetical protein
MALRNAIQQSLRYERIVNAEKSALELFNSHAYWPQFKLFVNLWYL